VCFPLDAARLGFAVGRPSSSRTPLRCALLRNNGVPEQQWTGNLCVHIIGNWSIAWACSPDRSIRTVAPPRPRAPSCTCAHHGVSALELFDLAGEFVVVGSAARAWVILSPMSSSVSRRRAWIEWLFLTLTLISRSRLRDAVFGSVAVRDDLRDENCRSHTASFCAVFGSAGWAGLIAVDNSLPDDFYSQY